jgi:hypothetical protein
VKEMAESNITHLTGIESLIRTIRGAQVILDYDLSSLYGVENKRLNEQVKRNIERFPEDFMFQLDAEEWKNLKSQNATSSWGGTRKRPFAFTENGVAMLSSVLRSQTAIKVNINIMRAFTIMRNHLADKMQMFQRIAKIEKHQIETDKRIDEVFKRLNPNTHPQEGIFFNGQIFDAYRFVSDLIRKARNSIILIDNYVDETVLSLFDKRGTDVYAAIYTKSISRQLQLDIERHNAQYPPIELLPFNKAHDRFLLLDNDVYHIGASIKDLGKKWFAFTLFKDIKSEHLLQKIQENHD